jgi:hypothetical protein
MHLTDAQIARLLAERKPSVAAGDLLKHLAPDAIGTSRSAATTVPAADGGSFILRVRQNSLEPYDFSIILSYAPAGSRETILRRHNGPSHRHRNPIEDTSFEGVCHIHIATERYQLMGSNVEHYAEQTDRFHDVATALVCMLNDANFEPPAQRSFPGL